MLYEKIKGDMTGAMKERREFDLGVLRMLITALNNRLKEKRGEGKGEGLSDDDVLEVLRKEAKKRKEASELYAKGGRPELEQSEKLESEFIEKYLPAQLGEAEIAAVVKKVIVSGKKDFGEIMKEVMKELKGKADGRLITEIIKKLLASESAK